LSIIDNENLRKILAKGPNYREPQSINYKYTFKLLIDSVEDYARNGQNEKKRRLIPFQNGSKLLVRWFKFESEILCTTLDCFYKTTTKELPSDTLLEFGNRIRPLAWKAYPDVNAGLRDE